MDRPLGIGGDQAVRLAVWEEVGGGLWWLEGCHMTGAELSSTQAHAGLPESQCQPCNYSRPAGWLAGDGQSTVHTVHWASLSRVDWPIHECTT
jgi:hypothetical protein